MNTKELEVKRLKTIMDGMSNKGYKTTHIQCNMIITFLLILVIFSIPYLLAGVNSSYANMKILEILLYTIISTLGFWALQYYWGKNLKDDYPLVKLLKDQKAISRNDFIKKHVGNLIYCLIVLGLGVILHNYMLVTIGSYLMAFDYPYLFILIFKMKAKEDAYLVYYPTAFRGALVFEKK